MNSTSFRFAPDVIRRLAEELIPRPDVGILELVRNSYDADATRCKVDVPSLKSSGGVVTVEDNGVGMTSADVVSHFFLIGSSSKSAEKRSRTGRLYLGSKGLGRLAALRMGTVVRIKTQTTDGSACEFEIDWRDVDAASDLADVSFEVRDVPRFKRRGSGTTIEIAGIAKQFQQSEIVQLRRSLSLLMTPFPTASDSFVVQVAVDGEPDKTRDVRAEIMSAADYVLTAELDGDGRASAAIHDGAGNELATSSSSDLGGKDKRFVAPPARLEMYTFLLSSDSFAKKKAVPLEVVRNWLRAVSGVHFYHRSARVSGYGDEGDDWTGLNIARARSPEERPSTNNTVAALWVEDPDSRLTPRTDRTGFVEGSDFLELKSFVIAAQEWMYRWRLARAERRRSEARTSADTRVVTEKARLLAAIDETGATEAKRIVEAFETYEKATEKALRAAREDLLLYRTLSTVGTTAAVLAHEVRTPLDRLRIASTSIRRALERTPGGVPARITKELSHIDAAHERLQMFAALPLTLLQRRRRLRGSISLASVVEEVVELMRPLLAEYQIAINVHLVQESPKVRASVSELEGVVLNLLGNAVRALSSPESVRSTRLIGLSEERRGDYLVLRVEDSGPGIRGLQVDEIWLPGRSTYPSGTGLGLTIVRDTVEDLEGFVLARESGPLGGAVFEVGLPMVSASSE